MKTVHWLIIGGIVAALAAYWFLIRGRGMNMLAAGQGTATYTPRPVQGQTVQGSPSSIQGLLGNAAGQVAAKATTQLGDALTQSLSNMISDWGN